MSKCTSTKIGNIDVITDVIISGWYINTAVHGENTLALNVDGITIAKFYTDTLRPDVAAAGFNTDLCGFTLYLSGAAKSASVVEIVDMYDDTIVWRVDMQGRRALNNLLRSELPSVAPPSVRPVDASVGASLAHVSDHGLGAEVFGEGVTTSGDKAPPRSGLAVDFTREVMRAMVELRNSPSLQHGDTRQNSAELAVNSTVPTFVFSAFLSILSRIPTPEEFADYSDRLHGGFLSREALVNDLREQAYKPVPVSIGVKETSAAAARALFAQDIDALPVDQFVRLAYRYALARDPDPSGGSDYEAALRSGQLNRAGLLATLAASSEAVERGLSGPIAIIDKRPESAARTVSSLVDVVHLLNGRVLDLEYQLATANSLVSHLSDRVEALAARDNVGQLTAALKKLDERVSATENIAKALPSKEKIHAILLASNEERASIALRYNKKKT